MHNTIFTLPEVFRSGRCTRPLIGLPVAGLLLAGVVSSASMAGLSRPQDEVVSSPTPPPASELEGGDSPAWTLEDRPIAEDRLELLETAFAVVTAIPVDPHVKDRSTAQMKVLEAMLELDQPRRVGQLARRVDNWRRAQAFAKVALHAARDGAPVEEVRALVELSDANHPEELARWRHDEIDVNLARALVRVGDLEGAARLESGFEKRRQGAVVQETAGDLELDRLPRLLEAMDAVLEQADFDQVRNTVEILVALHRRFYDEVPIRVDLERRVDEAAVRGKLPHDFRIRANLDLVDNAIEEDDIANARLLVGRARGVLDSIQGRTPFPAEYLIPVLGEMARRRAEAGEVERARAEIEEAMRVLDENRRRIPEVFRARALGPVAAAAAATDDADLAGRVFRAVVEEGALNGNARPRAEDLARTLTTMALVGYQPDAELQARIDEIVDGLGDPW